MLMDGRDTTVHRYPEGHWVDPTVFDAVRSDMIVGREEIFGPVAGLPRADSLAAAFDLVHQNSYGNMASLFTTSGEEAR